MRAAIGRFHRRKNRLTLDRFDRHATILYLENHLMAAEWASRFFPPIHSIALGLSP
jgi:hypothetical protein